MTGTKWMLVFILLFCQVNARRAETHYPKNYFRSPVNFQILLAGSFGELRKNHFHSGIDIRTEGQQGKPVYTVADGYVSRVFISPYGFGKALYITHPNGYVSVYGHLRGFNGPIGAWIRNEQYRKESFALDTPVDAGILRVKKGDLIAYSGNSGSSGGPHLHFEIRDAVTQDAIDPLLFGLPVKDMIPPKIQRIRIYPLDQNSMVNNSDKPVTLAVAGSNGSYQVASKDTVSVSGNIIFGIEAFDMMDDNGMKHGVHSIDLFVDTAHCFSQCIDRFAFAATRYVNCVMDYPAVVRSNFWIQRSYIAPNNKIDIYGTVKNRGIVNFSSKGIHRVQYIVKDEFGNTAKISFWVRSHPPAPGGVRKIRISSGTPFSCKTANHFTREDIRFDLPQDALYEDLDFQFASTPRASGTYSPMYHLQDEYVPLQSPCDLSIKAVNVPQKYTSKTVIVKEDPPGHFSSRGGKWENGFVKTQVKEFGNFTIMVDTVPPVIIPVNVVNGKKINRQSSIMVKISDYLSGIKHYRGTINGKWILMDYDAKNNLLTYAFDDRLKPGRNEFRLVVRDDVGNEAAYSATLNR
jgi:hypothetical protein